MSLITYVKAYIFHDLNAAIKLSNKKPSPRNIKLVQNLSGVNNIDLQPGGNVGEIIYQSQSDSLLGKSIAPNIASNKLHKVYFNGCGEIFLLAKVLKKHDFKVFVNNMVKPLKETPVKNSEGKIRTAAECAIDMSCAIRNSDMPDGLKQTLENELKSIYLSGSLSIQTLDLFLKYTANLLGKDSSLVNKLKLLMGTVEKEFFVTKHNDNYYGRFFDSTIAEAIVNKPSDEMNRNIEIIKNKIVDDFILLGADQQDAIDLINSKMKEDPAVWRSDIPEVANFLDECTPENFIKMVNAPSEIKNLLIMHLAVKYVTVSPGFRDMVTISSDLYTDVIYPQRHLSRVKNNQEVSNRTGIRLSYQMQGDVGSPGYIGERPMDRYQQPVGDLIEHNQEAIISERPIVIGMSGSANLLNYLFISLNDEFPDFDVEQARLLAASFLTHSGGHSINEAYTVYGYKDNKSFKPVSYSTLLESNDFTKKVINNSYDKLIEEAMTLN